MHSTIYILKNTLSFRSCTRPTANQIANFCLFLRFCIIFWFQVNFKVVLCLIYCMRARLCRFCSFCLNFDLQSIFFMIRTPDPLWGIMFDVIFSCDSFLLARKIDLNAYTYTLTFDWFAADVGAHIRCKCVGCFVAAGYEQQLLLECA